MLRVDWDQSVPPQHHRSGLQAVKRRWLWGGWHPLQLAWTGPEDNHCPWPYSVMESTLATDYSLLNRWCSQFQVPASHARKVEGKLANIIRTCQVFFSIFIYVQRLARSFQMPGMYCSLEELQYPAVFNVKGKPFH